MPAGAHHRKPSRLKAAAKNTLESITCKTGKERSRPQTSETLESEKQVMTWREQSMSVIIPAFDEVKKANPDMTTEQIMKKISKDYYPFYEREYFPYKAWLKAIKDFKTFTMKQEGTYQYERPRLF